MAGGDRRTFKPFTFPSCQALYHIVKVEAGLETVDRALTCLPCGAPLPSREGKFVLKYFFLRKGGRTRRRLINKLHQTAVGRIAQLPGRLVMLCDWARGLARSDRPEAVP
jgi:hypothetical protein